ncbi:GNAT family N-acetyltransferase, partial [Halobacteriales archaeon QS_1_68_17]
MPGRPVCVAMPGPVFLDGGTVSLHPIEDEDLDFCLRGVNEPSVWRATDLAGPTTERAEREWLDAVSADDDELALLICADGSPAGVIGLSEIDRTHGTARIGFWIAPDRRGNGYATAAVELLVGYAFDHLRLHRVEGDVYAFNDASRRVPEIAGFGE